MTTAPTHSERIDQILREARGDFSVAMANEREVRLRGFLESTLKNYAQHLGFTEEEILLAMEEKRFNGYPPTQYYTRGHFLMINDWVRIYDTQADLEAVVAGLGYRCGKCRLVTANPNYCDADRENKGRPGCAWRVDLSVSMKWRHLRYVIRDTFLDTLRIQFSFVPLALEDEFEEKVNG